MNFHHGSEAVWSGKVTHQLAAPVKQAKPNPLHAFVLGVLRDNKGFLLDVYLMQCSGYNEMLRFFSISILSTLEGSTITKLLDTL